MGGGDTNEGERIEERLEEVGSKGVLGIYISVTSYNYGGGRVVEEESRDGIM